jgi:hypothetical protein
MNAKDFLIANISEIIRDLRAALPSRAQEFNDLESNVRSLAKLIPGGSSIAAIPTWASALGDPKDMALRDAVSYYLSSKRDKATREQMVEEFFAHQISKNRYQNETGPDRKPKKYTKLNVLSNLNQSLNKLLEAGSIYSTCLERGRDDRGRFDLSEGDLYWLPEHFGRDGNPLLPNEHAPPYSKPGT